MAGEITISAMMALMETPEPVQAQPLAASIIARAKAGDREAFEQLFIRYQRQVLRTAARMLTNFEDAQDATQEVFLRLHKYLHRFQEEREFSPWLYQVTANVCREIGAKRRSQVLTVSFEQERETGRLENLPGSHDVEAAYNAEQERRVIAEAIASLPEKERMALVLRDLQGLETSEVARILGSSETTVRSQISMARVKIKRYRDRVQGRSLESRL